MAVFSYSPKLKRDTELAFGAHFLHIFHKNVSYLILYQMAKLQCQIPVFLLKISKKMCY